MQGNFSEWYELPCRIHQGGFMSLMKYAIFINSLLVNLKNANICCKIYTTPVKHSPYADDIAMVCLWKKKLDKAMEIVHNHGCAWCYDLNAKKSAYNHESIWNSIFDSDHSGIEECISKGRRVFNTVAGIGIRKGGVSMATCNVVFSTVVVPSAWYGCEMWVLDDVSLKLIEDFQNYIGKRVQHVHPRIPNTCSFSIACDGCGWRRLFRYVNQCP